jgi:hypothetical protein
MFKGRLIIEDPKGTAVEREITIAEGEGLLFKMGKNVGPDAVEQARRLADGIEKWFSGEEKYLILYGDVEILKVKTEAKPTPEELEEVREHFRGKHGSA